MKVVWSVISEFISLLNRIHTVKIIGLLFINILLVVSPIRQCKYKFPDPCLQNGEEDFISTYYKTIYQYVY